MTPGLDYTRLFISLTAGAGTRCMSLLSSSPSLLYVLFLFRLGEMKRERPGRHASAKRSAAEGVTANNKEMFVTDRNSGR